MAFKHKTKLDNNEYMTTIKRCVVPTDEVCAFIKQNSDYRRLVWNQFVEEYYNCIEKGRKFIPSDFKNEYFNSVEKPNNIYERYCVGISEDVMKDIKKSLKISKKEHGRLHFKRYDPFRYSFKVHTRANDKIPLKNGKFNFNSRVQITDTSLTFRVRRGKRITFQLKESFYGSIITECNGINHYCDKRGYYSFTDLDIKSITFLFEDGKYYILLQVKVLNLYNRKLCETHKRDKYAGVDLGIHNPIALWDGYSSFIFKMSEKEIRKIHYLERRMRRFQSIMSRKMYNSNNYLKILQRFRIAYQKIVNIRINWRRKTTRYIATRYKNICADRFNTPTEHETTIKELITKFNTINRFHGMFLTSELLEYACIKYRTNIISSPENTTRQCSICGELNPHLPLSQRTFVCKHCGYTIDRDINASQNCYDYLVNL